MADSMYPRRWATLAVLCLSLLVITIDATIVNTTLPTLARDLGADMTGLQWIVDAYTLAFAGLLLLAGALGDRFGRERALRFGLVVFGLASAVAAFATSTGELVAMRAVMGVGAAFVMPATLGIVMSVFRDPQERVKALGAWAAVSGLGVALGPTTAGLLLERFDWGAVFLVNVPLVAVALALGTVLVPRTGRGTQRLDLRGALLGVGGLGVLTWTLIEAPRNGWLAGSTLAAGAAAVALLGLFWRFERRVDAPLLDVSLVRDRRVGAASAAVAIAFLTLFGMLFVLTQIFQFVFGLSTLEAGLAALPFAAVLAVASPVSAIVVKRRPPRLVITCGLTVMGAGLVAMSLADAGSSVWLYIAATIPVAAGMGFVMAPATELLMSCVPQAKASTGAAMNSAAREVGGVLGVAVVGSITASLYASGLDSALAGLTPAQEEAATGSIAGASIVGAQLGGAPGAALVDAAHAAFLDAASTGLLVAGPVALAGALLVWLSLASRAPAQQPLSVALEPGRLG